MIPVSFLLVLVSQIFLTTVIVRYDHMEKYEAQLLIFAAQCCFIWYQIKQCLNQPAGKSNPAACGIIN